MIVGYARVSSESQSLDVQQSALVDVGCERLFVEKVSGASTQDRDQLRAAVDFVRDGDTLVVTKLDRLARSVRDLMDIHDQITKKGVSLRILNMGLDTTTPTGKLMLGVLGSVAEFERNMILERQADGIAAAKARGVYRGGTVKHDPENLRSMVEAGMSKAEVARQAGCSRMTVHRACGRDEMQ